MIRDLTRYADRVFDVIVIGGGIYGLATAYDAAQRGLAVALVERGDFGGATSFNHLKTIHGGLRHLQSADLIRMRESIVERRTFARIAPKFVAPLAFAMPTGASLTRNPIAMKLAFAIDAMVGRDRNEGVDASLHLPAGHVVAGSKCREMFEGALRSVPSAAVWHDYETIEGDRLTLSFAKAADAHGAILANYVDAIGPLRDKQQLAGIAARDVLTGSTFEIRARRIVVAAGPWSAAVLRLFGVAAHWPLLKAMNLVTTRPARSVALAAPSPAGRALILLPWRGRTLIGTSESARMREADDQAARETEVEEFLAEVNATFPALGLKPSEITLVHRGIVPASVNGGHVSLLGQSRVIDHETNGDAVAGLISIVGVKYTTARRVAERAVDLVSSKAGRPATRCRTAEVTLPGAASGDSDAPDRIVHAIRDEMAHTLCDVVVRRTGAGAVGYPGDVAAADAARQMQLVLAWSDQKMTEEMAALRRFYDVEE